MIIVNDEFKKAFALGTKRLLLSFDDGTELTLKDVALESMELEQSLCDQSELRFGEIASACFKIQVKGVSKSYKDLWFNASIFADEYEVKLGRFCGYEDSATSDRRYRDLVAYDKLFWIMNQDVSEWYAGLTFPISLKNFRDSFFNYVGIEQVEVSLATDSIMVEQTIETNGITGLKILKSLCEINACFGCLNGEDKFRYVQISSGEVDESLSKANYYLSSLRYEEFDVQPITKVTIREESDDLGLSVGTEGNVYVIQDNFLLYGASNDALTLVAQSILDYAKTLTYTPASFDCKGAPWREVGDMLEVAVEEKTIRIPILNRILNGTIALKDSYSAEGAETYGETNQNSIAEDIKKIKSRTNILYRDLDETRSEISRVETNLQKQIDNNIETYSDNYVPTLLNAPAYGWTTDEEKDKHLGDLYHVNSEGGDYAGFYYRFEKTSSGYQWTLLKDTEITKALKEAEEANQKAQEVADDLSANYSTTVQMNSAIKQAADEIDLSVSKLLQGYSTTEQMNAAIKLSADGINTEVAKKVGSDEIISKINQSPESVVISANRINLEGAVTFSSLDAATQSIINTAKTEANAAISTASAANTTAANALTKANATDATLAQWCHANDKTLIDGGKIYSNTITADKLRVNSLSALTADLGTVTAGRLEGNNTYSTAYFDLGSTELCMGTTQPAVKSYIGDYTLLDSTWSMVLAGGNFSVTIPGEPLIEYTKVTRGPSVIITRGQLIMSGTVLYDDTGVWTGDSYSECLLAYGNSGIYSPKISTDEIACAGDIRTNAAIGCSSIAAVSGTIGNLTIGKLNALSASLSGTLSVSGVIECANEIITSWPHGGRIAYGDYGTFWRNDGANLYLMFTAAGNQYGSWNALRPLFFDLQWGNAWFGHNLTVGGALSVAQSISVGNNFIGTMEFQSANPVMIRSCYGKYGAFFYNEGGDYFYLLVTDANNPYGGFNNLRPFYINMGTGSVNFGHDVGIDGVLWCNNQIRIANNVDLYCMDTSGIARSMVAVDGSNIGYLGWGILPMLKVGCPANTGRLQLFSKSRIDLLPGGSTSANELGVSLIKDDAQRGCLRGTLDNTIYLGNNSYRFAGAFLGESPVIGSDRRLKNNIVNMDDRYMALAKLISAKTYNLNNPNSTKRHVGYIANDIEEAMASVGLSEEECAFFNKGWVERDDYTGYELSLVYEELHTIQIASLQKQVNELQNRLAIADAKIINLQSQLQQLEV